MTYQSALESYRVVDPQGRSHAVEFQKAGFLTTGDQPELYFFLVDGEEVVVGVSGEALRALQQGRRYLTREQKIDVAGLHLKRRLEAGKTLVPENLYVRSELGGLLQDLGIAR